MKAKLTRTLLAAASLVLGSPAGHTEDADTSVELAAVTSPRQAGSPDFELEKQRADVEPVALEVVYKADVLGALESAHRDRISYLGNLDLKLTVAGEKAFGLAGNTLFAHLLHNHGSKPNARIGALQGIDNIEVATNTGKLYQFWVQQQLLDDRLSVLFGLYDLNSEFYVTDASAIFLHPALGIGSELAQTGANGPSIFPTTSLGLRARVQATPDTYLQAVVLDGVPGNPNNPRGTHIRFDKGDGALWVTEVGYRAAPADDAGAATKLAAGYWRYTGRFDDQLESEASGDPLRRRNTGFYLLGERPLLRAADDPARGLAAFVRLGLTKQEVNPVDRALAIGAIYQGPFQSRRDDVVGFAIAAARTGATFRRAAESRGETALTREIAYELTYRAQVKDWLAIQPELQHIRFHGSGVKPATIAGLRIEASF